MLTTKSPVSLLCSAIATCFFVGKSPFAPGTMGSLAALPMAWAIVVQGGFLGLLAGTIVASLIGWWVSTVLERQTGTHDASEIVIDEVAGQWLSLLPAAFIQNELTLVSLLIGFALFRLFDILKPGPVGWADRNIGGGLGVMIDDLIAGAVAAAVLAGILTTGVLPI